MCVLLQRLGFVGEPPPSVGPPSITVPSIAKSTATAKNIQIPIAIIGFAPLVHVKIFEKITFKQTYLRTLGGNICANGLASAS